jgi:hypothetical protein
MGYKLVPTGNAWCGIDRKVLGHRFASRGIMAVARLPSSASGALLTGEGLSCPDRWVDRRLRAQRDPNAHLRLHRSQRSSVIGFVHGSMP